MILCKIKILDRKINKKKSSKKYFLPLDFLKKKCIDLFLATNVC